MTTYFVASYPTEGKIVYLKQGQAVLRDLLVGGQMSFGCIAIDQVNARLYSADNAIFTIWWYQLVALPDGRLTTDGRKHKAVGPILSHVMEVDGSGNLYVGGQAQRDVTPSLPAPPVAIHKFAWFQLLTNDPTVYAPNGVINSANSGGKLHNPSAMATDGFRLFFGNGNQGGTHGTLLESTTGGGGIKTQVDQGESLGSVAITPDVIFYSTENGVFAIGAYKAEEGCGKPADTKKTPINPVMLSMKKAPQGPCHKITSEISNTKGMVWDGDGTVYTLDPAKGIYSFPSGNMEEHKVKELVSVSGLTDMSMLQVSNPAAKAVPTVICMVVMLSITNLQH